RRGRRHRGWYCGFAGRIRSGSGGLESRYYRRRSGVSWGAAMTKHMLAVLFGAALAAAADPPSICGPVSGFVHDPGAPALLPVLGVPGAAWLGPAILSDANNVSVSRDGFVALAISGEQMLVGTSLRRTATWTPLNAALPSADLFAWSDTAAAVYSSN